MDSRESGQRPPPPITPLVIFSKKASMTPVMPPPDSPLPGPSSGANVSTASTASSSSSSGKPPCRQCAILEYRMKQASLRSLSRTANSSVGAGDGPQPTPKPTAPSPPKSDSCVHPSTLPSARPPLLRGGHGEATTVFASTPLPQPQSVQSSATLTPRELFPNTTVEDHDSFEPEAADDTSEPQRQDEAYPTPVDDLLGTKMSPSLASWALTLLYITLTLVLFTLITSLQPVPFIDEIFHIPQAQKYCVDGNFTSWDNKITTPPGLYLVSFIILRQISLFTRLPNEIVCSVNLLRATNLFFALGNFTLIWAILKAKMQISNARASLFEHTLATVTISLLPPLYFFTFLYYTDPGSMFTILLTLWCAIKGNHAGAALSGFSSLWFRQTNIVWLFLAAGLVTLNILFTLIEDVLTYKKFNFSILGFRKRFPLRDCTFTNPSYVAYLLFDLLTLIGQVCGGYLVDGLLFLAFLSLNGGIVLGDRSAHQPVLHLAQLPYFLSFVAFIGAPVIFTPSKLGVFFGKLRTVRGNVLILGLSSLMGLCLTDRFTYVHPYLLADNRHYVFYLWRRLWANPDWPQLRFVLVPLYVYTALTMWSGLDLVSVPEEDEAPSKSKSRRKPVFRLPTIHATLAKVLFALCTLVTILPQALIEFRYFLVPYLLWRLHLKQTDSKMSRTVLTLEFLWALAINGLTIGLFAFKIVKYSEAEPEQRLIW